MKNIITICLFLVIGFEHVHSESGWGNSAPMSINSFRSNLTAPPLSANGIAPIQNSSNLPLAAGASGSIGNSADFITPEIQALADGLQGDPIRIFNHVYNYIDFQAYYGCKKGAAMTLMEGKGNAFDTSALLVALLRASGYTASYEIGPVIFHYNVLRTWLGFDASPLSDKTDAEILALFGGTLPSGFNYLQARQFLNTSRFLTPRGYPIVARVNGDNFVFDHVWVKVTVDVADHLLDPSLKGHHDFQSTDFLAASGYNQANFLASAAGTPGTDSIKQISEAGIATQLTTLSTTASNWIRANKPMDAIDVLLQGRRIQKREISNYSEAIGVNSIVTQWHPSIISTDTISENYMSKLNLSFGSYNYSTKQFTSTYHTGTFNAPELIGKKIALTFSGNTGILYFEDDIWASFNLPLSGVDTKIEFTHDHYIWVWNGSSYVKQDTNSNDTFDIRNYRKGDNFYYAIPYGFDVNGKLLRKRQKKLAGYLREGKQENSREVQTEILNIMGLTWLYQTELSDLLVSANKNISHGTHHRIGRVSQEEAFYIDFFSQQYANVSRASTSEVLNIVPVGSMFHSALEHAIIEQTLGSSSQAASTIKMLHLVNQASKRIFRAHSANWQTGSHVRSKLTGYSSTLLATLDASITAGATILVPEQGDVLLGTWEGTGYIVQNGNSTEMNISGGYNGGYNSQDGSIASDPLMQLILAEPGYFQNGNAVQNVPYTPLGVERYYGADPVDMSTGAFTLDKTDLELGSTIPRGLVFSRSYNANRRFDDSPGLGYGWTHNHHIRAVERTSIKGSLGLVTSYQMVPWLVASVVASDVYESGSTAKTWAVSSLIAQWATDQLRNNAVSITVGKATMEFVKMPDGSYAAPAGSKMTLSKVGDHYELSERHGSKLVFNSDGRLGFISDLHGNTATYSYASGNLSSVTDSYGRAISFTWNGSQISAVSDSTGRNVGFAYSGGGNLITFTDVETKNWFYDYNADHQIERLRDPENRTITENAFDSEGRVVEQKSMGNSNRIWKLYYSGYTNIEEDPTGTEKLYYYDERGRPIGSSDGLGNADGMAYDGQDHVIVASTPKLEISFRAYNADNNLVTETDPKNHQIQYFYDAQLHLQKVTDKRGKDTTYTYTSSHQIETVTDPLQQTTTFTYYANGLPKTVKDAENKVTTTAYDSWGNINKITLHDSTFSTSTNNSRGDVLTHTDAESRTITNTWNNRRQRLTTTAPDIPGQPTATITNTYDNSGNLATSEDGEGNVTTYIWNALGKPVTSSLPALPAGVNTVTSTYDSRDWLSQTTNSLGHIMKREYDSAHRLSAVVDPLNRRSENTYDSNGQALESKDPLNRITKTAWNNRGEMEQATDGENKNTNFLYDNNGNQIQFTDRRGKIYLTEYDDANRLKKSTTPSGKITELTYYSNNQIHTIEEPSGDTTTITYNARSLVHSKADSTGTITYGYDDSGSLLSVSEGAETITRTYNERGQVKTYTNTDGETLQYVYNTNGSLTRLTYPDGKQVHYTYNARNQLKTVTDWSSRVTTYEYDRLGRLVGTARPNGTVSVIERDAGNQVLSVRETANGKLFSLLRFNYDPAGQVSNRFHAPLVPPAHQQPTFSASYDDDNRLLTVNTVAVSHDDDGNMTQGPISPTSGNSSLTYNSRNQLTDAEGTSYIYDSEGHRRLAQDSTGITRYTIDPTSNLSHLLIKHAPDGGKTYYVYGIGLLYEVDQVEKTKTYHFDQVGSTISRTDDTGKVIGRAEYTAYGQLAWSQHDMDSPFLYNGQWGVMTDSNGLLNMRARYYSPYLMRFLNADPSGFSGGSNWFAYADGNPVSNLDPFGLWGWRNSLSLALDFIPVVGTIKSVVEVVAGHDFIAGEDVNRGIAAAGIVAGLIPGGKAALKGGTKVFSRVIRNADEAAEIAEAVVKNGDGFIYKRINPKNADEYIGQAQDTTNLGRRKKIHDGDFNVKHDYDIVARGSATRKIGRYSDLDVLEETMIRKYGGIGKRGGNLSNGRHQVGAWNDPSKYIDAVGGRLRRTQGELLLQGGLLNGITQLYNRLK